MGRTYKISIIRLVTQTIAFMSSPVTLQGTSAKSTTVPPKRPEKNKRVQRDGTFHPQLSQMGRFVSTYSGN